MLQTEGYIALGISYHLCVKHFFSVLLVPIGFLTETINVLCTNQKPSKALEIYAQRLRLWKGSPMVSSVLLFYTEGNLLSMESFK